MKKFLAILIGTVMILGLAACGESSSESQNATTSYTETTVAANAVADWPADELVTHIPTLTVGTVTKSQKRDSGSAYEIHAKLELQEYKDYVEACKKMGYTEDVVEADYNHKYKAFNSEGYKVYLTYDEDDKDAEIWIYAPIDYTTLVWPTAGLGSKVPAPSVEKGLITTDTSDYFYAYFPMDSTQFSQYVNDLMNAGYSVDYSKSDGYFHAKNSDGVEVYLTDVGGGAVELHINAN